jgi:hypothetical protein
MMGAEGSTTMQARQLCRSVRQPRAGVTLTLVLLLSALAVTACGSGKPAAASPVKCGSSRTAGNTPVEVEVMHGQVACAVALQVERSYAEAIRDGKVPGNGGGAPVPVSGWTCQGYPTPHVLQTGQTSKCVKAGTELLTIEELPGSS